MNFRLIAVLALSFTPFFAASQDKPEPNNSLSNIFGGLLKGIQDTANSSGPKEGPTTQGKAAELWMDKEFNPSEIGDSMHLRIGLSSCSEKLWTQHGCTLGVASPRPRKL